MWSYLDEENISRAAEFITDCRRFSKYCGIPERVAMPWSSRDRMSHTDSDWNTDLETDRRTLRSCRNTGKQSETVFVTGYVIETSCEIHELLLFCNNATLDFTLTFSVASGVF